MSKKGRTLKLVTKRLKITKRGKVLRRLMQQGHNKAKMPSGLTRSKRKRLNSREHPLIQRALKHSIQRR